MENTTTNKEAPIVSTEDPREKLKVTKGKCKRLIRFACLTILFQLLISSVIASIVSSALLIPKLLNMDMSATPLSEIINMFLQSSMGLSSDEQMLTAAIAYVIANPLAAFLGLKMSRIGKIKPMFKGNKFNTFETVCACCAATGCSIVITLLSTLFSSFFAGSDSFLDGFINGGIASSAWGTVVTVLYVCILGPITEEILCRGAVLRISSPVGKVCAIVLSSVLFGFMHGNYTQMINATLMGLVFGYVAIKSESLIVPCIMHIFNNSISTILSVIAMKLTEKQAWVMNIVFEIVIGILGILGLIYLIKKHGKITKNDKVEVNEVVSAEAVEELKASNKGFSLKVVLTCPIFWIVFVYCNYLAILIASGAMNNLTG